MNFHSQQKSYSKNPLAGLNDEFRHALRTDDMELGSATLKQMSAHIIEEIRAAIAATLDFGNESHDFGFVEIAGMELIWAINYLNKLGNGVAQNPLNAKETMRSVIVQMRRR